MTDKILFSDFAKLDLRVAQILKAEEIPNKDKLLKLTIDLKEKSKRTIVAGIKQYYKPEELKGKKIIVIANLQPTTLAGVLSDGMLLAALTEDRSKVILLAPEKDIPNGSKVS